MKRAIIDTVVAVYGNAFIFSGIYTILYGRIYYCGIQVTTTVEVAYVNYRCFDFILQILQSLNSPVIN